jgi:hypothetical protein
MSNTNKTGRKPTQLNEITDRAFTVVDLINLNTNVKALTVRMYVKRNVEQGRYVITGTFKSGKRGKPSTTYTFVQSQTANVTEKIAS